MRVKIKAKLNRPSFIPFNYQYQMHAAIINIIQKSSPEYADFLHKIGFKYEKEIESEGQKTRIAKTYKYYTFSNLKFSPKYLTKGGFKNVRHVEFIFSTIVDKSFENMILGIFSDNQFHLQFYKDAKIICHTEHVETLPETSFSQEEQFNCLSPILVTTETAENKHHCLDYMIPEERIKFVKNIRQNLVRKYEGFYHKEYEGTEDFEFYFDPVYIVKRQGKISKLKKIPKNGGVLQFKGFEAPFNVKADPELIKIGYEAGFGVNNAMGWGCVEKCKTG